jgi:hypothetical protein
LDSNSKSIRREVIRSIEDKNGETKAVNRSFVIDVEVDSQKGRNFTKKRKIQLKFLAEVNFSSPKIFQLSKSKSGKQ